MIILFILLFFLSILVFYFANKTRNQAIALEETQQQLSREISERQQAETALQQLQANREELVQQNQLLQSFFQASPIGLGIFDPGLKYLQINQALAKINGIPVEEHSGKTIDEIIPQLAPTFKTILHQVLATGEPIIKLEIWGETSKQPGSQHWEASYFPLLGEDKCLLGIGCAVMDASDRVRTEVALRENEERFRQITENIREVFYLSDLRQHKVLYVNPAYEIIWGRSCQSLYEKLTSFLEAVHPEDLSRVKDCLERQKRGESTRCEYKIVRPDGSVRWVWDRCFSIRNEKGEPYRWCGVVEDITERKQLEESFKHSLNRLKNLHQLDRAILKLQEPAAIATSAIGHLQQMLPCQRITINTFDWEAEVAKILVTEGVGNDLVGSGQLFELKSISNLLERLQQNTSYLIGDLSLFTNLPTQTQALKALRLNQFISFPLRAGNNLLGVLNLWLSKPETLTTEQLDIAMEVSAQIAIALQQANLYQKIQTYATQLEERVAERTGQLESLNQQLEDFTYSASHDLRAPLRAMQGFATAILEDYGEYLDDLGRQYAQRLVSSAERLERLIQDLLSYGRLSRTELRLRSLSLSTVVAEAIKQLEVDIQQRQALVIVEEPLPIIWSNHTVLLQVVSNLLANAIKFVAPGVQPQVKIWAQERDNYVRLWVEDNGIGIAPEHQKRIFKIFERLHGSEIYDGTGIGLAIVSKGMERLGGSVSLESAVGEGSRFWIEGLKKSELQEF